MAMAARTRTSGSCLDAFSMIGPIFGNGKAAKTFFVHGMHTPPQSTPSSSWFFTPSEQLEAGACFTTSHTRLSAGLLAEVLQLLAYLHSLIWTPPTHSCHSSHLHF